MPRAVVTGGAGFVGSHLCERLLREGWDVLSLDSLLTGRIANLDGFESHERFRFESHDVTTPSPSRAMSTGSCTSRPRRHRATISPPDPHAEGGRARDTSSARPCEGEGGRVPAGLHVGGVRRPAGPSAARGLLGQRQPHRPAQRLRRGEALRRGDAMAYLRVHGVQVKIARIFNTYGPRLRRGDGRAVPTFIEQALGGDPITVTATAHRPARCATSTIWSRGSGGS